MSGIEEWLSLFVFILFLSVRGNIKDKGHLKRTRIMISILLYEIDSIVCFSAITSMKLDFTMESKDNVPEFD